MRIAGRSDETFLLSTYVCHPALANDNLSGVVVLWALARGRAGDDVDGLIAKAANAGYDVSPLRAVLGG